MTLAEKLEHHLLKFEIYFIEVIRPIRLRQFSLEYIHSAR